MKNILSILAAAIGFHLNAQTLVGLVREQNSNKKPISGVQVIFKGAVPTISDDNGNFRLALNGKKPGDLIFYEVIQKTGYELVNDKELELLKVGNTNRLGVDIILAKTGTVDAAKKEYYQVSDKALRDGFARKKQELQQQIKNAKISQQQYLDKLEELQEQYDQQQRVLNELAEKFAKVNFDDVSAVYQEALELFKTGKVDEAIKKLEDADFLLRSENHLEERKRIASALGNLNNQNTENELGLKQDVEAMLHQARIYVMKNQPAAALPFYELLLKADGDNPNTLLECADFFKNNGSSGQALMILKQILALPTANETQKKQAQKFINILSEKKD